MNKTERINQILKEICYWNEVSTSGKAISKRNKYISNKKRIICPNCKKYYLITAYVKFQPGGGILGNAKWIAIGKICPTVSNFIHLHKI